jgi:hypothetical protein
MHGAHKKTLKSFHIPRFPDDFPPDTYIKKNYIDKNNGAVVVLQYSHLYKTWKVNTGIKVNPQHCECMFDEDFEVWKFSAIRTLKPVNAKS